MLLLSVIVMVNIIDVVEVSIVGKKYFRWTSEIGLG